MMREDAIQEYLERLEAGTPFEALMAELTPEDAELLKLAITLRETEVPARSAEAVAQGRVRLMQQAAAASNVRRARVQAGRSRPWSSLRSWLERRTAFDWALLAGVAPAVLVLVVAGLFGLFLSPANTDSREAAAVVDDAGMLAEGAVSESAGEPEQIASMGSGAVPSAGGALVAATGEDGASSDAAKSEISAPVGTMARLFDPRSALVEGAQGLVQIQESNGAWRNSATSDVLLSGQRIRLGAYSRAKLLFYDGSEAKLGAGAELSLDEVNALPPEDGFRTVVMTQYSGETQHHVDFRNDAGSLYQVKTPTGSGIARGTTFNVMVSDDLVSQYSVEEGVVDVSNAEGSVLVHAQQISTVSPNSAPTEASFIVQGQGEVTAIISDIWTIGGQDFVVNASTILIGDPGLGDIVLVMGHSEDGDWVADQIWVLQSTDGDTFTIVGQVNSISDDEWVVAGQTILISDTTEIEAGIVPSDLVKVEGLILEGGDWLAQEIKLVDDTAPPPVTIEMIGYVDEMDPWVISGFPFDVISGVTEIDSGIEVGSLVKVTAIVQEDGSWLATEIVLLGDDDEEVGCFSITAIVLGIDGNILSLDEWPDLEIDDGVDVTGDIADGSVVIISFCIDAEGNLTLESIVVISGIFPPPPGEGQDKVTLCHKPEGANPHEITIARPAVQAHLNHGDFLGACDGEGDGSGDDGGDGDQAPAPAEESRVAVCHKPDGPHPQTLMLPESAADAHLNHGDTLGACDGGGG